MDFESLMQSVQPVDGGWGLRLSEDWLQGRSAYGGLQVSIVLKAMRALIPDGAPLRTVQVTFLAPVPANEDLRASASVLRAGKNATHIEGKLWLGEQLLCLVIGVFGATRESAIRIRPSQPEVPAGKVITLPQIKGVTPDFLQHFDVRWLSGPLPYSGASEPKAVIEVGFKHSGTVNELHLPAIADVIPPLAITMLRKPAPGSSMTWMLELLADRYDHLPLQGWRFDAEVLSAADGYTSQTAMIWAPDGSPAMLSRQSMVVFG